jgi:kynureninase
VDDHSTSAHARELDAADPLSAYRDRFVGAASDLVYFDGNSLGRPLRATAQTLADFVEREWGGRLIRGWDESWFDLPLTVGDDLGRVVLGAAPGQVTIGDSTTVLLYKAMRAAVAARPGRTEIVLDRDNFPTDRYVLEGLAAQRGRELRVFTADPLAGPQPADLEPLLEGSALVLLSHVSYRAGALADMHALTALAREHGAHVVWDLSHSAGAVPVELDRAGVELAVGCTYKYLNAGPGAPAFLYVTEQLQPRLRSPIWGWFGQRDQFAMERDYDPIEGVGRFLAGTPPVLDLAAVEEGVRLTAEAGVDRLRAKSVALCDLIVELHDAWLAPLGFSLGSPRDGERRGSHVSIRHDEAWPICRALIERAAVVPDFRGPDSIRLGVAPLYTGFADVWDALDRLRRLVQAGEQRMVDASRARVT